MEQDRKSINGEEDFASSSSSKIGEEYPFFGRRTTSRRGCKLTMFLTLLVVCAAATVVVLSIFIAKREQISADLLLDIGSVAADFAFWDPSNQILYWVDRSSNQISMYDPVLNRTKTRQFNHSIGIVMPRYQYNDSIILTSGNYVATYNFTTEEEQILTYLTNQTLTNETLTSFTDGRCDPGGGLWLGAADGDLIPDGVLYRMDPLNVTVSAMLHNITTPGGMAWSRDRKSFFFIDSKNSRVNAYTYAAGTDLVFQRVAFVVPPQFGTLSGMTVDITDSLWVAIIGPPAQNSTGKVCRYDPFLGQLQETIQLPVSQVTSCVFGGPNLDQLYITTRQKPGEKNSGGIYVAKRLGVTGAAPYLYGG